MAEKPKQTELQKNREEWTKELLKILKKYVSMYSLEPQNVLATLKKARESDCITDEEQANFLWKKYTGFSPLTSEAPTKFKAFTPKDKIQAYKDRYRQKMEDFFESVEIIKKFNQKLESDTFNKRLKAIPQLTEAFNRVLKGSLL